MAMNMSSYLSHSQLTAREEPTDVDVTDEYERDITAILYSKPFSRLRHKTQVFLTQRMTTYARRWSTHSKLPLYPGVLRTA